MHSEQQSLPDREDVVQLGTFDLYFDERRRAQRNGVRHQRSLRERDLRLVHGGDRVHSKQSLPDRDDVVQLGTFDLCRDGR
jgi:hypothetical protein